MNYETFNFNIIITKYFIFAVCGTLFTDIVINLSYILSINFDSDKRFPENDNNGNRTLFNLSPSRCIYYTLNMYSIISRNLGTMILYMT